MHFIEISNIFKSEKKRYKVTAVLKLLVVFALLGFFLSNKPMYHVQTDFYLKRMGFVFLACFWMVFVTVCDIRLSQKVDRAFVIILGVIAPVMGWILSEFLINEAECAFPPTPFYQKDHFGGSADHIFDEQHQSWISDRTICIVYLCGSCMCCI